jgi:UDPglucose 6-dehydrogenase
LPPFTRVADPYAAAELADALVLVTEWQGIDELRLDTVRSLMRRPVFVDTRNHFDPARMAQHGLIYIGVGRGSAAAERATSQKMHAAGALA